MSPDKLSSEQLSIALKVIEEAERQGVNPDFALSVALAESAFNPEAISSAGAIGVMQLMPNTAKDLGVDPKNVEENIQGGIKYLKQLASQFDNDTASILAAYNAGPNSKFFKTGDIKDLPTETIDYVNRITDYAGGKLPRFTVNESVEEEDVTPPPPPPSVTTLPPGPTPGQIESSRFMGNLGGAGAGLTVSGLRGGRDVMRSVGRQFSGGEPAGMRQPTLGGPLTQMNMTPGQKWASKVVGTPGFQAGPDDYSVKEAAQRYQRAMPQGKVSGPAAKRYGINAALDVNRQYPSPVSAPRPGPLDQVTRAFTQIAESGPGRAVRSVPTFLSRYAAPPVGLAMAGGELLGGLKELEKPNPNYGDVALSGLGVLGGALSLYPPTAPIGIPMSMTPAMVRYFKENQPEEDPSLGLTMP
jgi:hypothetical protein